MELDTVRREGIDQRGRSGAGPRRGEGAVRGRLRGEHRAPERHRGTGDGRDPQHLTRPVDRYTIRVIAEYQACERISKFCALLASADPRFSRVGRRAEDPQEQRRLLLDAAGFDIDRPYCDTATIYGRTYQLPDATASVVREIAEEFDPIRVEQVGDDTIRVTDLHGEVGSLPVALMNTPTHEEEMMMPTPTTDPNAALNGGSPTSPALLRCSGTPPPGCPSATRTPTMLTCIPSSPRLIGQIPPNEVTPKRTPDPARPRASCAKLLIRRTSPRGFVLHYALRLPLVIRYAA